MNRSMKSTVNQPSRANQEYVTVNGVRKKNIAYNPDNIKNSSKKDHDVKSDFHVEGVKSPYACHDGVHKAPQDVDTPYDPVGSQDISHPDRENIDMNNPYMVAFDYAICEYRVDNGLYGEPDPVHDQFDYFDPREYNKQVINDRLDELRSQVADYSEEDIQRARDMLYESIDAQLLPAPKRGFFQRITIRIAGNPNESAKEREERRREYINNHRYNSLLYRYAWNRYCDAIEKQDNHSE